MNILIIGLGVIGSTYGFLFKQAGHHVEHYLRNESHKKGIKQLSVSLLDGRMLAEGIQTEGQYDIALCSKKRYDLIFVSVAQGKISSVMQEIRKEQFEGTFLICCNLWLDRAVLDRMMQGYHYILGFPVAGGRLESGGDSIPSQAKLDACVFDHFMLENVSSVGITNGTDVCQLFASCHIQLEQPHDMIEWIALHMAINAAVITVAGVATDINDSAQAARRLMNSTTLLAEVIKIVRETLKIVASRGINLKLLRDKLWLFYLPARLSAYFMKRMFARNHLTRRIMELHGNIEDLLYICECVYNEGKSNHVSAPIFYRKVALLKAKL